jgi:ParB family transcriptional regulator, chromosome partitioning protein
MSEKNPTKHAMLSLKDDDSFFSSILKSGFEKNAVLTTKQQKTSNLASTEPAKNTFIITIDPNTATNWEFPDRPQSELGDIESLGHSMRLNGQAEPCIARLLERGHYKYEIIAGERRWRAAKLTGIKLEVLIRSLTDSQAAILQAVENLDRKDLSDYARGISLAKLMDAQLLTQEDLQERFGLSKTDVTRLIAFSQLPEKVIVAIGDMTKISARLAAEIRTSCNRGFSKQIILLASKISSGQLGAANLKKSVDKLINPTLKKSNEHIAVTDKKGNKMFSATFKQTGAVEISAIKKYNHVFLSDKFKEELRKLLESFHMET